VYPNAITSSFVPFPVLTSIDSPFTSSRTLLYSLYAYIRIPQSRSKHFEMLISLSIGARVRVLPTEILPTTSSLLYKFCATNIGYTCDCRYITHSEPTYKLMAKRCAPQLRTRTPTSSIIAKEQSSQPSDTGAGEFHSQGFT
jgi:hypothetical protein